MVIKPQERGQTGEERAWHLKGAPHYCRCGEKVVVFVPMGASLKLSPNSVSDTSCDTNGDTAWTHSLGLSHCGIQEREVGTLLDIICRAWGARTEAN